MSSAPDSQARQLERPVVSVTCDGGFGLCQELVRALAETVPGHIYRINPKPKPDGSFDLTLTMDGDGQGHLHWPGGAGDVARQGGHNDAEFARDIVAKAGPALVRALNGS